MTECARRGCTRTAKSRSTGLCGPHYRHLVGDENQRVAFPAARFQEYLDAGYPPKSIAKAAGLWAETVRRAHPDGQVFKWVRDAILTVDLETAPMQPGWRATRRIRALAAAGLIERDGAHWRMTRDRHAAYIMDRRTA